MLGNSEHRRLTRIRRHAVHRAHSCWLVGGEFGVVEQGGQETFGAVLRRLRNARGLTQAALAERVGLHPRTISDMERFINKHPQRRSLEQIEQSLGLSDEELAELEAAWRRGRPGSAGAAASASSDSIATLATASPQTLLPDPLPADDLIGRSALLNLCCQRLRKRASVALFGWPGVGKSTLALAVAHDRTLRSRYYDLVLYAALGPEPDISALLGSWGAQLHIASADAANAFDANGWASALRQGIGERRALVIVDDVWRSEDFHAFKVGGPSAAYLATTRFPALASEIGGADAFEMDALSPEDGLALLKRLAPRAVEQHLSATHRLIEQVGALPLALRLIGNYLRHEAMGGQPRRIQAALQSLASAEARLRLEQAAALLPGRPTASPNARISLQAIIGVSVERLSAEPHIGQQAARALWRLAVFPPKSSSFSEEAAMAVCEIPSQALDALYDYGLLESHADGRYALHQVMRDYARLHIDAADLAATQRRMLAFFATLCERHGADITLLTLESANIHAALRDAVQRPLDRDFVRAVNAFAPFMELRGEYEDLRRLLTLAEGAAVALDDAEALSETRLHLGSLAETHGAYQEALALYQSALAALTTAASAERLRVTLLARCAEVALRSGNGAEAERLAQQGLERAQAAGSRASMAFLLRIIAQAAGDRGDLAVGDTQYRVALKLAEEVGDVDTAMSCLQNMGAIAFKRGQFGHAILLLNQGLREAKAIGHIRRVAAMLNALGCVYVKLASCPQLRRCATYDERAEQSLTSCLQLATRYHLPLWQNHAAQNLGALERGRRRFAQAEERLREALAIAEQMGDRWIIAETECELGELYLEMGKDDQTQAAFERAIAIASEYGDEEAELLAWAGYGLGRLWAARGDIARARDCGEQSRTRFASLQFEQAAEVQRWLDTLDLTGDTAPE